MYFAVSGSVVDADSGAPLPKADVAVVCADSRGRRGREFAPPVSINGVFAFTRHYEDGCSVRVQAEGYIEDSPRGGRASELIASGEQADRTLRFALQREGEIRGTVLDRATEEPVAGLTVWAQWSDFERGKRRLRVLGEATTTDAEGRYRVKRLPPGDYFLQVGQAEQERIESRALPAAGISSYVRTYWPGGAQEAAVPLRVQPGALVNAGDLFVERSSVYRVHALIQTPLCAPGRIYRTVLWQLRGPDYQSRATDRLACGQPFTIRNLTPGAWWLETRLEGGTPEEADAAVEQFEVKDKDVGLQLNPLPALRIALKVTGKGGDSFEQGEAVLAPMGWPVSAQPEWARIRNGLAALLAPASHQVELRLRGLGDRTGILTVRYNGGMVDDEIFTLNREAPAQSLEVVLTAEPPALTGTVKEDGKAAAGALVVVAPWPSALRAEWPKSYRAKAEGDGSFAFPPLPPGEYRVFGIAAALAQKLEEPEVLLRLIGRAATVVLRESETSTVALRPAEP